MGHLGFTSTSADDDDDIPQLLFQDEFVRDLRHDIIDLFILALGDPLFMKVGKRRLLRVQGQAQFVQSLIDGIHPFRIRLETTWE